jgi:hypothetical protein
LSHHSPRTVPTSRISAPSFAQSCLRHWT